MTYTLIAPLCKSPDCTSRRLRMSIEHKSLREFGRGWSTRSTFACNGITDDSIGLCTAVTTSSNFCPSWEEHLWLRGTPSDNERSVPRVSLALSVRGTFRRQSADQCRNPGS